MDEWLHTVQNCAFNYLSNFSWSLFVKGPLILFYALFITCCDMLVWTVNKPHDMTNHMTWCVDQWSFRPASYLNLRHFSSMTYPFDKKINKVLNMWFRRYSKYIVISHCLIPTWFHMIDMWSIGVWLPEWLQEMVPMGDAWCMTRWHQSQQIFRGLCTRGLHANVT